MAIHQHVPNAFKAFLLVEIYGKCSPVFVIYLSGLFYSCYIVHRYCTWEENIRDWYTQKYIFFSPNIFLYGTFHIKL